MTILNSTPFCHGEEDMRDINARHVRVMLLKATFDIVANGQLTPSDAQRPICEGPLWVGDPGRSSMIEDADWAPVKAATDIAIIGSIYAPRGHVATRLTSVFRIGSWQKSICVTGDREICQGAARTTIGPTRPFYAMPIGWERCFGGVAANGKLIMENPIGCGHPASANAPLGQMPNFEDPHAPSSVGRGKASGLGFIDRGWYPRLIFAGTYDDNWMTYRRPLFPRDINVNFFNSSPADMVYPGTLQGGEPISLINCLPNGDLKTALPRLRVGFEGRLRGGAFERPAMLDTCLINLDAPSVTLVWRANVPIAANENETDIRLNIQLN